MTHCLGTHVLVISFLLSSQNRREEKKKNYSPRARMRAWWPRVSLWSLGRGFIYIQGTRSVAGCTVMYYDLGQLRQRPGRFVPLEALRWAAQPARYLYRYLYTIAQRDLTQHTDLSEATFFTILVLLTYYKTSCL